MCLNADVGRIENGFLPVCASSTHMRGTWTVTGLASNAHFTPLAFESLPGSLIHFHDPVAGGMAGSTVAIPVIFVAIVLPFIGEAIELLVEKLQSAGLVVLDKITLLPSRADGILYIGALIVTYQEMQGGFLKNGKKNSLIYTCVLQDENRT